MNRAEADALAVAALTFLGEDPERLGAFLGASGASPEGLRQAARSPAFWTGVLDYVVGDEGLLLAFASHAGVKPEAVAEAWGLLSGPAGPPD